MKIVNRASNITVSMAICASVVFSATAVNAQQSLIVNSTGDVGIGTSTPGEAVDVERDGAASRFQLTSITDVGNEGAQFIQRRARAGETAVQSGDTIGLFSFRGHTGGNFSGTKAAVAVQASQTWSGGGNGTQIAFSTTQNGTTSLSTVLLITNDKKVKINGTELNVPDYVFEDEYKLMPLDDLHAFVKENKHLPKVASAKEVNSDGLDLGGTQMQLLEKVEELTLYTLNQHEQLKAQDAMLNEQRAAIEYLTKKLDLRLTALEVEAQ